MTILVYAIVLHFRFIPKMKSAWLTAALATAAIGSVVMTYFGVNYFLTGLHSYAQGDAAQVPDWVYIFTLVGAGADRGQRAGQQQPEVGQGLGAPPLSGPRARGPAIGGAPFFRNTLDNVSSLFRIRRMQECMHPHSDGGNHELRESPAGRAAQPGDEPSPWPPRSRSWPRRRLGPRPRIQLQLERADQRLRQRPGPLDAMGRSRVSWTT